MLQFIVTESERWSAGELAQMAVEGGCGWITIHLPELSDAEIREIVGSEISDMCRESGVFLTIDDNPQLARELGLHGVRLSKHYFMRNPGISPLSVREELGPEAIIGIETTDVSALQHLRAADIDFLTLPSNISMSERSKIIADVKQSGIYFPIVAEGNFTVAEALEAVADGCAGVAVGAPINEASHPEKLIQEYIDALNALKDTDGQ